MIPISLSLKNFLSYGPTVQTINFAPYSLICLSGKNGHGKSALLDAMTWAVWGQARKIAGATKADDSLLRLSETEMQVVFEFCSADNQYRIKRAFFRSGNKGTATLDFGLVDKNTEKTIALTGKTIRETQSTIEKTIGLDFDTFVNSAFLRQGGSNEFSKKSPRERKEILARILSLDQYEMIKKGAAEKLKNTSLLLESKKRAQEKRLEEKKEYTQIDESLEKTSRELAETTKEEDETKKQITKNQYVLAHIRSEKIFYQTQIIKKRELLNEKNSLAAQLTKMRADWISQIAACIEIKKITPLIQKKEALTHFIVVQRELLHQKMLTQQDLSLLTKKKEQIVREYEIKNQQLQEQYIVQRELLKKTMIFDQDKVNTIVNELKTLDLQTTTNNTNLIITDKKIKILQKNKNEYSFLLQHAEKRITLLDKIVGQKTYYQSICNDLEKKLSLLCNIECATCPICDHELSPKKQIQLHESIKNEITIVTTRLNRIKQLQIRLERFYTLQQKYKAQELHTTKELQILLQQQSNINLIQEQLQEKKVSLEKTMSELQTHIHQKTNDLKILHDQFVANQYVLANDTLYNETIKKIAEIEKIIKDNTYNKEQYITASEELQKLETIIIKTDEHSVKQNMIALKERIKTICLLMKKNNQEQYQIIFAEDKLQTLIEKELLISEKERQNSANLTTLQQKKELLSHQKGTLETKKEIAQAINTALHQTALEIEGLEKEIEQYSIITNITGRDGIQALLIEQAVPEIEHETNTILSCLTNNQMQLFIESIKDLKSGKIKETLDIKISDAEGIRSYDLFSGGEAFRIDLALRIGISKLLATRAGTTLETLIIDEGFGSQDEEGIALVIESLYKIQEHFKKIIIVSHLTNIKEQIPVHFLVSKGIHGSTVQVMQG